MGMVAPVGEWWLGGHDDGVEFPGQAIGRQAFCVDIDARDPCAAQQQRGADIGMARIFAGGAGAVLQDQSRDDPQRVLRAHGDEDLVWRSMDAAPRQGARTDIVDQPDIVGGGEIAGHEDEILAGQRTANAIAPDVQIEQGRVHLAIEEWIGIAPPVERLFHLADHIEVHRHLAVPIHRMSAGRKRGVFQVAARRIAGDAIGAAVRRLHIALRDQFLIGERHRDARDVEIGGKPACGGQQRTRLYAAGDHGRSDRFAELGLQAQPAFPVDEEDRLRDVSLHGAS